MADFLCRLGIHQWFSDGAWFTKAEKCGRCRKWRHEDQGAEVDNERDAWMEDRLPGETDNQRMSRVAEAVAKFRSKNA